MIRIEIEGNQNLMKKCRNVKNNNNKNNSMLFFFVTPNSQSSVTQGDVRSGQCSGFLSWNRFGGVIRGGISED